MEIKDAKFKGRLIIISAPSGTGKGRIISSYLDKNTNVKLSISYTTRERRPDDKEDSYYFLDEAQFETMISNNDFLEYAKAQGIDYYGTPKEFVLDNISKGNDVLLEINYEGALKVKQNFPQAVMIFLLPPSAEELYRRLVNRGGLKPKKIHERYNKAFIEVQQAENYEYIVINDNVDSAVKKIEAIAKASRNIHDCSKEIQHLAQSCKINTKENKLFIDNLTSQLNPSRKILVISRFLHHLDEVKGFQNVPIIEK